MKITALVALAANFLPAALGADFALYYSTHDASWEDRTGSDRLLGNTNLFPGKHTEVPAGGKPTDVQLNDGQGNRLKTLGGVPFTKSYREHSWLITTGSTTINCGVKPLWPDEKFNVGDINVILRLDENKKIQTELRRARGEGSPGFLDPLRFDFRCDVF